jgi:hypothetical protein
MPATLACLVFGGAHGRYFNCYSKYYYICRIAVNYDFAIY